MKKSGWGVSKGKKRTNTGRKHRKKMQPDSHKREHRRSKQKSNGSNSRMAMALLCASAGLPVAPLHGKRMNDCCTCGNSECSQPGRHPRTTVPTTDRALIKKYWTKWPNAKIGVVLGRKSGLLALVAEGSTGTKTRRALEEKHREANDHNS
jgi:hypothetical protein